MVRRLNGILRTEPVFCRTSIRCSQVTSKQSHKYEINTRPVLPLCWTCTAKDTASLFIGTSLQNLRSKEALTNLCSQMHICRCSRWSPSAGSRCRSCSRGVGKEKSVGITWLPSGLSRRTCQWSLQYTCNYSRSLHPRKMLHSVNYGFTFKSLFIKKDLGKHWKS